MGERLSADYRAEIPNHKVNSESFFFAMGLIYDS